VVRLILNGPRVAVGMAAFSPWFLKETERLMEGGGNASSGGRTNDELFAALGYQSANVSGGEGVRSCEDVSVLLKAKLMESHDEGKSGLPVGLERRITWFVREWRR